MTIVKIDASELARAAAWIAKGKARTYVPVLNTVQVTTTVDGLRLRRTDFDLFREAIVGPATGHDGDATVLVDPGQLAALTKGGKGDALVTVDTDGVIVVTGARTVHLPAAAVDPGDYPDWPTFQPTTAPAVLDVATLKRGLTSAGNDDTLPMLTGVRFESGQMVTTDRFRLSRITFGADDGFTALVPGNALRLFTVGVKGAVSVEHSDGLVRITADGRSVITRVLDAEFPRWQHLIDSADGAATVVAEIRRADLLDAIGAGIRVHLELRADGTMAVSTRDVDGAAVVEQTIAATVVADELPFTGAVSVHNLTAVLKGIAGDVVTLTASTPLRPIVLKSGDDYHLVMPVKMPG
jgi:DNA polymerase III sliding clamp (beta) subunit (PCNA family)